MHQSKELQRKIQAYLPLHGARLSFMAKFVMAVIVVRGVTVSMIASVLDPKALSESNEKRVKRSFSEVELEGKSFATLILALLPAQEKLILTLDGLTGSWVLPLSTS